MKDANCCFNCRHGTLCVLSADVYFVLCDFCFKDIYKTQIVAESAHELALIFDNLAFSYLDTCENWAEKD